VIVVAHRSEEEALARLLARAEPVWLPAAALLQALTYLCALLRGFSFWLPRLPGFALTRRELAGAHPGRAA
jgi:hypothetical protein